MAVTAGIAGANLISQGEVSLVVWRGGVGWGGGSSPCTTVNTRYILIRCHRGVWSARENLSRIPGREWAEGGEQRKRAVTREQGGGADGSGGGGRRVCPLAVSVAYLSLSLSHSPERLSPPLVFLPFSPWLPAVHTFAVSSRRSTSGTSTLRKISTAAVTPVLHNRQRSFQKEKNKQSRKILLFTSPSKKKKKPHACTEIQAALVLFLSSAVLSGKVLLKKPGELESDMMFSSRPAPPGCTEAAQEHARH